MKKTILLTIISVIIHIHVTFAQDDSWIQVEGNGFGSKNAGIFSMDAYNGFIFAGTFVKGGLSSAQLWKSSTGDWGTYTQVNSFTPAFAASDYNITALGHTALGGGYMYLGLANRIKGAEIYSSMDGNSWTKISKRGMGNHLNTGLSSDFVVVPGGTPSSSYLYVGLSDTTKTGAASIWRTLYNDADSTHWTKVLDFSNINVAIKNVSWLTSWNNKLYAAVYDSVSHIYESSDGVTWTKNTGSDNGFGINSNKLIASMCSYNGALYAGTNNSIKGGQLWKTSNGSQWSQVNGDAFGQGKGIYELSSLIVANGFLWVAGISPYNSGLNYGDMVWRCIQDSIWTQSSNTGFSYAENSTGYTCLSSFNGYVYIGVKDTVTGGEIMRTGAGVPQAGFTVSDSVICTTKAENFTNTSSLADLFIWYKNGVQFATTTSVTDGVPLILSSAGRDTIMQIAINSSTSMEDTASFIVTAKVCPTGIAEINPINSLTVYPNPANGQVIVKYTLLNSQSTQIALFDITGKKMNTLYQAQELIVD